MSHFPSPLKAKLTHVEEFWGEHLSPGKCNSMGVYITYSKKWGGGVVHMGVSKNRGTPKWMVFNGKPCQNGWFWGITIFGNTHIYIYMFFFWGLHPGCVLGISKIIPPSFSRKKSTAELFPGVFTLRIVTTRHQVTDFPEMFDVWWCLIV